MKVIGVFLGVAAAAVAASPAARAQGVNADQAFIQNVVNWFNATGYAWTHQYGQHGTWVNVSAANPPSGFQWSTSQVVYGPPSGLSPVKPEGLETLLAVNCNGPDQQPLVVKMVFNQSVQKTATTTASKSSKADLAGPTIAGRPVTVDGVPVLEMGMNNAQDFSGNGAATQSNKLDGFITVTVHKRLSNGNLLVRGQKWVGINSGREYVRLQGIVRPSDIAPDNSVLSWRVADAYISYGGQGTVANASKPGWLFRFFNSPHTPF